MRFAFFGSAEFAKNVFQELLRENWRPVLVVTNPPRPKGRKHLLSPTPVHNLAKINSIPVLTPIDLREESFLSLMKRYRLDFAILTAYGKIIPPELLSLPSRGFLNLHPSLLPCYRGSTPIQSVILNGDKETGVTLFLMDQKIDHGPIIRSVRYKLPPTRITYSELSFQLAKMGAKLITEAIPRWLRGEITPQPQNESLATYCSKITPQDEKIDWRLPSQAIDRKVRALNPHPGVYTRAGERLLKIIAGFPLSDNPDLSAKKVGEVFQKDDQWGVKCGQGAYMIEEIKPAGKRLMSGADFLRGNKWIVGKILND